MSPAEGLRRGMVVRHAGQLFTVLDYQVAQSGKQKPTVHVKLRSLSSGNTAERTLDQLGTIEEVPTELREMQYLYACGSKRVFMDSQSYEQYELGPEVLRDAVDLLVEQESYRFQTVEGRPVALLLPPQLVLEVTDTAPPEHAGGGSNVYKEATLASGLLVHVPLFIKTGDRVRVNSATRAYQGKEH